MKKKKKLSLHGNDEGHKIKMARLALHLPKICETTTLPEILFVEISPKLRKCGKAMLHKYCCQVVLIWQITACSKMHTSLYWRKLYQRMAWRTSELKWKQKFMSFTLEF